jgi:transcription antitermination protein NusB
LNKINKQNSYYRSFCIFVAQKSHVLCGPMLSRRHLRIKVFQALYALESARDSNFRLAEDFIVESFRPDLNSMEPQNTVQLEGLTKIATLLLQENSRALTIANDGDSPAKAIVMAQNALNLYRKLFAEDYKRVARKLAPEVESIGDYYIELLQLIIELAALSKIERERVYENPDDPISRNSSFDQNKLIVLLQNNTNLSNEVIRRGISWQKETDFVRNLYKEGLRKDEKYREYCTEFNHTFEEDLALIEHILLGVLFKNDIFNTFYEQKNLLWAEDGLLLRKMLNRTFKSYDGTQLSLVPLTDAWDEDKFFMDELFKQTVEKNDLYEQWVAEPLKNWEIDRLALADMLILKMGICEMVHFPAIPTKVTINECIEMAKEYSTPNSGKFINGILDTLSKSLVKEGHIRKSGRGLIDNK